jgi:hypothetical protein
VGALWALLATAPAWAATVVEDPGQGPVDLPAAASGARELSGITWAGGSRFLAVSDEDRSLYELRIEIDRSSGRVRSASISTQTTLDQGGDLEGVAWAGDGTVYVSDERGPAIRRHDAATGRSRGTVPLPRVFTSARVNLSLESLALAPEGSAMWTANEEALPGDGQTNLEAGGHGGLVRLQRFAPDGSGGWRAGEQWAYRVDGVGPFLGRAPSGVVDLVALPGGALLVLERAVGVTGVEGEPPAPVVRFRSRLYAVDLAGATRAAGLARLGASTRPVGKRLLWEGLFTAHNFEGVTLGPDLENGDRTLLLVSDDGQGLAQAVYALRLRARDPSPSPRLPGERPPRDRPPPGRSGKSPLSRERRPGRGASTGGGAP